MIVETTGGLAPHFQHVGYLTGRARAPKLAKGRGAVDRTRYGTTRISAKSYVSRITCSRLPRLRAVVYDGVPDARAIPRRVTVLKSRHDA